MAHTETAPNILFLAPCACTTSENLWFQQKLPQENAVVFLFWHYASLSQETFEWFKGHGHFSNEYSNLFRKLLWKTHFKTVLLLWKYLDCHPSPRSTLNRTACGWPESLLETATGRLVRATFLSLCLFSCVLQLSSSSDPLQGLAGWRWLQLPGARTTGPCPQRHCRNVAVTLQSGDELGGWAGQGKWPAHCRGRCWMLRAVSRHLTNTPESVCCSVSRSESALRCLLVLYHPPLNSAFTLLQRRTPSVCPAEAVALSGTPHYRILHIILVFLIALCGSFQSRSVDLGLSWLPWVSRESNSCLEGRALCHRSDLQRTKVLSWNTFVIWKKKASESCCTSQIISSP